MSVARQIVRRFGFALFATYLVITITFAFVTFTPDPNLGGELAYAQKYEGASEEELAEIKKTYLSVRGRDAPIHERYVDWLVSISTGQWGVSPNLNRPVMDVLAERVPKTLSYVIPAMFIAIAVSLLYGLYSATGRDSNLIGSGMGLAYLGQGIPNFWLATMLLVLIASGPEWFQPVFEHTVGLLGEREAQITGLATIVLATSLVGGLMRYARAETSEYVNAEFVRMIRAKGASDWRAAWHCLRNAAIPMVSLFFSELLAVLILAIYVIEVVFGISGVGDLAFTAVEERDMPLILGTTMVLVFAGIFGNFIQDVIYLVLDPRVGYEEA